MSRRSSILEGLHIQRTEFVCESAKNLEISKDIKPDDKKKYKSLLKSIDKLANYKSEEGILKFYVDKVTTPEQVWLFVYGFNTEFEDGMEFERVWSKGSMEKSVKTLLNAFNLKDFTLWTSTYWNAKLEIKGKNVEVGPYVQVSFLPENVAESVNEGFYKKGKRYKTEDEMYFVVKKVNSDGTLLIYDEDVDKEYKAEISDIELLNPVMVKESVALTDDDLQYIKKGKDRAFYIIDKNGKSVGMSPYDDLDSAKEELLGYKKAKRYMFNESVDEGWNCKEVLQSAKEYPGSYRIICKGQVRKGKVSVSYVYYTNPNNVTSNTYLETDCNASSKIERETQRTFDGTKSPEEIKKFILRVIEDNVDESVSESKENIKTMHIKTTGEKIKFDMNTLDNTGTKWFFTDVDGRYISVRKSNAEILDEDVVVEKVLSDEDADTLEKNLLGKFKDLSKSDKEILRNAD